MPEITSQDSLLKEIKVIMIRKGWEVDDVASVWSLSNSQTASILNGRTPMKVIEHLLPLLTAVEGTLIIEV